MNSKPVSEPSHVAVDLYKGETRLVNGRKHSTKRTNAVIVVNARGFEVCEMTGSNQEALDTAWRIAKFLDESEKSQ